MSLFWFTSGNNSTQNLNASVNFEAFRGLPYYSELYSYIANTVKDKKH